MSRKPRKKKKRYVLTAPKRGEIQVVLAHDEEGVHIKVGGYWIFGLLNKESKCVRYSCVCPSASGLEIDGDGRVLIEEPSK